MTKKKTAKKIAKKAKKAADAAKEKFLAGTMVVYKGELKDNQGKVIIPAGKEQLQQDPELEKMNWLVEGVIGSIGV